MIDFVVGAHTDVGIKKKVNQDSIFFESAETPCGLIALAAICDGMGGLSYGERASAEMTVMLGNWFENSLAAMVSHDNAVISLDTFKEQMDFLVSQADKAIRNKISSSSGTTLAALFLAQGIYYTANVGDSRVYHLSGGKLLQLTKDQTLVQRELDAGRITEADIPHHPDRSVLLQCIGASEFIEPEFTTGSYQEGDIFLLCSDGFRHVVTPTEITNALTGTSTEEELTATLHELTELNMRRGEKDNVSAIAIKITNESRF